MSAPILESPVLETPILEARGLTKRFVARKPLFGPPVSLTAVDEVSLQVRPGETFAIVGESGSGKSTLARLLVRLIEPTAGTALVEGRDIGGFGPAELRALRREVQFVFQDPFSSLNPVMSVGALVEEPLRVHGLGDARARRARVADLLARVGLRPDHASRFPHEFSGGQRQRIGIARALASGPRLLIGDEPVSALDVSVQAQVINLLEGLKDEFGLTLVIIAHDLSVIRHMADRVAVMYLGRIVETGPTEALFARPRHPYTEALLAAIPGSGPRQTRARLAGDLPNPLDPPAGCAFHPRCAYAEAACAEIRPELVPHGARADACLRSDALGLAGAGLPDERMTAGGARPLCAVAGRPYPAQPKNQQGDDTMTPSLPRLAVLTLTTALATLGSAGPLLAQDLRIGLAEDPDVLDPDQSRTFVGRIVYASMCDKLVDITPELEIVPMLATDWSWSDDGLTLTFNLREGVTFQDGTPFDAEAVAYNIERSQTLEESRRKSEVASITSTEVTGPLSIALTLSQPDATLLAQLADRAGMMVSPTAAEAAGADFGANPVCAGPYQFSERVAQDRIVLTKFEDYWNADAYAFETVTFLPIVDNTVRLANLRSGDIDMLERLAATDVASVEADESLQLEQAVSLGYQGVTFNVGNGDRAGGPFGTSPALRQAFSLAIDREALNQVVFDGVMAPGNQPFAPTSPWYSADFPVPARDVEAAKALVAEAGVESPTLELQTTNSPEAAQIAQVIQAMVGEAGIDVTIIAKEFTTQLSDQTAGNFEASLIGWSGRVDPDGNIHAFATCEGGLNDAKYCNETVDAALNAARTVNDPAERKSHYDEAAAILQPEGPIVYLYHQTWLWALSDKVQGFVPYPDGMIRLEGVTLAE